MVAHGSAYVPDEILAALLARKQQIGQAEMLGAIVPCLSMPEALAGRDVLHWIDNTSAKAALVHGYSGMPDSARIAHAFHAWNMGLAARVWFEYVPSKANIADLPSRRAFAELQLELAGWASPLDDVAHALVMPTVDQWDSPLDSWVTRYYGVKPEASMPA